MQCSNGKNQRTEEKSTDTQTEFSVKSKKGNEEEKKLHKNTCTKLIHDENYELVISVEILQEKFENQDSRKYLLQNFVKNNVQCCVHSLQNSLVIQRKEKKMVKGKEKCDDPRK